MSNFSIRPLPVFRKKYSKISKKDRLVLRRINRAIKLLSVDPFYPGLKSHKTQTKEFGVRFSSRVTGDLRLIWDYDDKLKIIDLYSIDGHGVYK
jgi:mRNA-degrading endonuclease YafQ of YafQ-DinJ toxin-antitoxin module